MPPKMRFRFRKSVALWPGHLNATVSKRGVSLNGRLGIFSRSWGTRGRSTTIDMPGTSGIFWRREDRRRKARGADALETAFLARQATERRAGRAVAAVFALTGLALAGRLWLHPLADCRVPGSAGVELVVLISLLFGGFAIARSGSPRLRGGLGVLAAIGVAAAAWWLYGAFIAGAVVCS